MKELKVNLENLSETERSQLVALIEKANKPEPVVQSSLLFEPKYDSYYFFSDHNGGVSSSTWDDHVYDTYRKGLGNTFRTKEAAQTHIDYLKARTKVLRYMREREQETGWVADWSDGDQAKFNAYLDIDCVCGDYSYSMSQVEKSFYSSEEIINEVIEDSDLSEAMKTVLKYFQ
jgi:hypothetical protein